MESNITAWLRNVSVQTNNAIRKKGLLYAIKALIREGFKILFNPIEYLYYKKFKSEYTFSLRGKSYHYFYHFFNLTWTNERCVEIPIVFDLIDQFRDRKILEIGNVISHYFPVNHDILDKYEKKPGVMNIDVVDFKPSKKYDLVVSISTIEHVGWDEEEKDSTKTAIAIENLKNCLAPGGNLVVTTALGYNHNLDRMLDAGEIKFDEQYFLKRLSKDNRWIQITDREAKNPVYGHPYPSGNILFIGISKNHTGRLNQY